MINWARVSELREEIGAEDFGEIVEIFLEEVEEKISMLRDGIDNDGLEAKLHFLKGGALNLGFADFAAICEIGERAAAQKAYDDIDLPAVLECYETSRTAFIDALDSQFAA